MQDNVAPRLEFVAQVIFCDDVTNVKSGKPDFRGVYLGSKSVPEFPTAIDRIVIHVEMNQLLSSFHACDEILVFAPGEINQPTYVEKLSKEFQENSAVELTKHGATFLSTKCTITLRNLTIKQAGSLRIFVKRGCAVHMAGALPVVSQCSSEHEYQKKLAAPIYGTPIVLQDRLLAFFDVLGFSQMLETMPLADLHKEYAAFIDDASHTTFNPTPLFVAENSKPLSNFGKTQFVFDSLILVSNEIDPQGVGNFIFATIQLMSSAFKRGFRMRGCITLGDFHDDLDRGIFLSAEWPKLIRAEGKQEWTGAFIDDVAEALVIQNLFGDTAHRPSRNPPLVRYMVPVKDDVKQLPLYAQARWCLNWPWLIPRSLINQHLVHLHSPKRENTDHFISFVNGLPDDYAKVENNVATKCRFMKARSGCVAGFTDDHDNPVTPRPDVTIKVMEDGNMVARAKIR